MYALIPNEFQFADKSKMSTLFTQCLGFTLNYIYTAEAVCIKKLKLIRQILSKHAAVYS
jgi:hypothetical protein